VSGIGRIAESISAGMVLGIIFFGGLWWTVTRSLTATAPALWFGLSTLLRMALVLSGLYYFAHLGLPNLVACLCGLLVARGAVRHLARIVR
jgi:F1F0 ATPase subunit 2